MVMYVLWASVALLISLYSALWYYFKTTVWCRSQTCLVGKTAIITGANTGIGFETALDFAKRGARVILACRNKRKGESARLRIVEETGNEDVVVKIMNLASFASVRGFAKDINETEDKLDILVNNAGLAGVGDVKTEDDLQVVMQVNYFSSFLLTNLLLGLLKKSEPSRIINVSSKAAKRAKFNLDNLNVFTGHINDYASSKVCNILFTKELAEKLKNTKVVTFSLHPGTIKSEIYRHAKGHCKLMIEFMKEHFFKTCEEGAQTIIYTAVAKGIEDYSGQHFDNCQTVEPYETVRDPSLAKKLWEMSEKVVDLGPEEQ